MKTRSVLALLAIASLTACSDEGGPGSSHQQSRSSGPLAPQFEFTGGPGCSQVRVSEVATYDPATNLFNTAGQIVIGGQAPQNFTSVVITLDMNWDRLLAGKNFKATQREELTLENGDQLYMEGVTMSVPMSAPAMWDVSFTGKFVGGTGAFDGAHGNVFIKGLTVIAPNTAGSMNYDVGELCL